jgi:hypothetical protein
MLLGVIAVRNRSMPMGDEADAAEIAAACEGWHVWESDTGRWWAARKATLTAAESSAGCAQYLQADTARELGDQIAADEALSARLASMPTDGPVTAS